MKKKSKKTNQAGTTEIPAPKTKPDIGENPLVYTTKNGNRLTLQQWTFCKNYVDMMGFGTEAALAAYDIKASSDPRSVASAISAENLRKPSILECIREMLDGSGLNDEIVDTELSFVVRQHENVPAKVAAIKEYNSMKGRHAAQKIDLQTSPLLESLIGSGVHDEMAKESQVKNSGSNKPSTPVHAKKSLINKPINGTNRRAKNGTSKDSGQFGGVLPEILKD